MRRGLGSAARMDRRGSVSDEGEGDGRGQEEAAAYLPLAFPRSAAGAPLSAERRSPFLVAALSERFLSHWVSLPLLLHQKS